MKLLLSFGCACLVVPLAYGGIVFSNGLADYVSGTNMNISAFRVADDFTLSTAVYLDTGRFWSDSSSFTQGVSWAIYRDSAGALDTPPLFSGLGVATSTTSYHGLTQHEFSLGGTLLFLPGTYWLEIHDGVTLTGDTGFGRGWTTSVLAGNAKQDGNPTLPTTPYTAPGYPNGLQVAFQLDGSVATPEPASAALAALGFMTLFVARRRLRASRPTTRHYSVD